MKINVEGISEGARYLESSYTSKALDFIESGCEFVKLIHVAAKVTKMGDDVFVECSLDTALKETCSRCLEIFPLPVITEFQTLYVPDKPPKSYRRDVRRPILSDEDDRVVRYKGKEIDLSEEILNAIRLFLPMKLLCRADCRGLCPHCGVNRNLTPCGCEDAGSSSNYQPFRDLKSKLKDLQ